MKALPFPIRSSRVPIFILAGGLGTRISEETHSKPKPMVEIGGLPILVHIMRYYYAHGFNDFIICGGYRVYDIKKYFLEYQERVNDLEIDNRGSEPSDSSLVKQVENWRVRVLDTGENTMTGGRLARAFDKIHATEPFETFGLTYGDGLCDVDLSEELRFHLAHGATGTVLGVKNLARFGELRIDDKNRVSGFYEKPDEKQGFINGGFFFFQSKFRSYLPESESSVLEKGPLTKLAEDGELRVFTHNGFWQCMDTVRDRTFLQGIWGSGKAPWIANQRKATSAEPAPKIRKGGR